MLRALKEVIVDCFRNNNCAYNGPLYKHKKSVYFCRGIILYHLDTYGLIIIYRITKRENLCKDHILLD